MTLSSSIYCTTMLKPLAPNSSKVNIMSKGPLGENVRWFPSEYRWDTKACLLSFSCSLVVVADRPVLYIQPQETAVYIRLADVTILIPYSESRQHFLRVYVVLQIFYWHLNCQSWLDRDWETGKRESNWIELNGICHNVRAAAVIGSDKVQLLPLSTTLVRTATITSSYKDV